jgi:hypothetical protein
MAKGVRGMLERPEKTPIFKPDSPVKKSMREAMKKGRKFQGNYRQFIQKQ